MEQLPDSNYLSLKYCNRWSGILNIDGKYVKVKGYKKKIPFIWSVDYLIHDFPSYVLACSENEQAFLKLFRILKTINYPLQIVICDDVVSLKKALKQYYPKAKIQLCHTHYIENIRQKIHFRTTDIYHHFFHSLIKHVFTEPQNNKEKEEGLLYVLENRTNNNEILQSIIVDIAKKYNYLFAYENINHCPKTNNIIESFNSHLNGRLKTIKGFQSFKSAERWLNAYLIRRRTKPFTDCKGKFKKFNRKMPLQNSIKKQADWPDILNTNFFKKNSKIRRKNKSQEPKR